MQALSSRIYSLRDSTPTACFVLLQRVLDRKEYTSLVGETGATYLGI